MYKLKNIEDFVNEAHSYKDTDEVDYKEINLQKEYDKLNKQLFNNELPNVKMKWDKKKGAAGHVRHMRNRMTGDVTIKHLSISIFFRINYREFLDTLAHEMIHVHNIHFDLQRKMYDAHGEYFVKEMNRINSLGLGFNVNKTKDSSAFGHDVSSHVRMKKPLIAVLFKGMKGKDSVIVMTYPTWQDQHKGGGSLLRAFEGWVKKGSAKEIKYIVVKSYDSNLMKYKVQRSFQRKVSWSNIDPDNWTHISTGGDILKQDTISKDDIPEEEIKQQQTQTQNVEYMKKERRRLNRLRRNGRISDEQWEEGMKAAGFKFR